MQSGLKAQKTKSHGVEFFQLWFGSWHRYNEGAFVTAHKRHERAEPAVNALLQYIDASLSKTARYIRRLDECTAVRMRYFHRYVSQYVVGIAAELEFKKGEEPAKGKGRGFLKSAEWLQAEGKGRKDTSKFRIGGLGTVMAISSGKTDYHWDDRDNGMYRYHTLFFHY